MKENKVIVIGIDGGTFDIILPMIDKGELPILKSLMAKGSYGTLQSSVPPYTWTAIASFLTGANPGKHGIFDFTGNNHDYYENNNLANSSTIRVPTFWDILTGYNKKIISFLFPLSYPPQEINGVMVSRTTLAALKNGISFTFPDSLKDELMSKLGGIDFGQLFLGPAADRGVVSKDYQYFDRKLRSLTYKFDKEKEAVRYLMGKFPWNVCMLYFNNMDLLQHGFWRFMDKGHHLYSPDNGFSEAIRDGYRKVDAFIGEIVETMDSDTTVIIFSDHGFGPLYYKFYLNKWLKDKGLLRIKKTRLNKSVIQYVEVKKVLGKIGLRILADKLSPSLLRLSIPVLRRVKLSLRDSIDWTMTKAYGTTMGININLKGRETNGIVEKWEYDRLVRDIRSELRQLRDVHGSEIIEDIFQKEEVYHGPLTEYGTDILFTFKKNFPSQIALDVHIEEVFKKTDRDELLSGGHFSNTEGIFIIKGPRIRPDNVVDGARLIDILPTVLYLFGLPIHSGIDGCTLKDVIDMNYLNRNPVMFLEETHISRKRYEFTEEERRAIQNELKGLGYIE